MGKIIYNGIDCGGGGSGTSIEPNPSGAATDTLEKLGIDGTIYNFEGTTYTAGTNIQINENVISATDTTYSAFQGTDGTEAGSSGLVPAPAATDTNKYLKSDGTWATVSRGGGSGNVDDVYVNGTSVLDSNHIAQVKSYKELTQAQYDALPASKLTDNILYCIKDVGIDEGDKFAPIIYSLDEREVGTWIDGKPLYQKTIVHDTPMSNHVWTDIINDLNINIKMFDGYIYLDGYPYTQINYYRSTTEYSCGAIVNNEHKFQVYSSIDGVTITCKVTLYYTKTTDTAGSGSYNTLGAPTVHYTTDEQVIGTWIDGKPLYQKSYENLNIGTVQNYTLTLSDLQNIEYFRVVPEGSQVSVLIPFPYVHYGTENLVGYLTDVTNGVPSLEIRKGSAASLSNLQFLTIQYTKTTD